MELGPQPHKGPEDGFSSQACHTGSAAATQVSLGMVSVSRCSGRTDTLLTANNRHILGNISRSATELHKRSVSSPVPRQREQGERWGRTKSLQHLSSQVNI